MAYRTATIADAGLLAEMNSQLIRDEGHRNRMTLAELAARMAGFLSDEYRAVIFENETCQVYGYALFRHDSEYVYLRQFFIRPQHRRQGQGRAAIAWLCENVWNQSRVRVEVLVANAAGLAFWRAVGFQDYSLTLECQAGRFQPEATG